MAAALACIWACEKEPGDGSGNDPEHALTPEQEFWGVVGQLVDMNDMTPDYKGKTFQPTIGSELEPGVRVVGVNSLEAAVGRYNTLTGASIDTLKATHTYSSKEVGTLTWNKGDGKTAWGTVDVSIPAVPSLTKIIYRSPQQGDTNGGVDQGGSAYYRFGDVIKRTRDDNKTEYWVCVRPAFDPEGKGKSHWISVSPLPEENIWPYYEDHKPFTASNGFNYGLPYNIREDTEWYQDLAEMLFAICYPDAWFSNIGSYSTENMFGSPKGLPIFNDFHSSLIKYHNSYFWKKVQNKWIENDIFNKVFGISFSQMQAAVRPMNTTTKDVGPGLHFLYKGHSWWTKTSNKPQLWEAHYTNDGTKDTQKNMHKMTPVKPCSQVVTPNNHTESNTNYPFNVHDLTENKPYISEPRFFGDSEPRWIIRYAEGSELAQNGNFNPQIAMLGFDGVNEVYRYYRDVLPKNLTEGPEETPSTIEEEADEARKYKAGYGNLRTGTIVKDEEGSLWFCYYNWFLSSFDDAKIKDHYSRFISFDGIESGLDSKNVRTIRNTDLMPEEEAPLAALCLSYLLNDDPDTDSGKSDLCKDMRTQLWERMKFSTSNRLLIRDSTVTIKPGVISEGSVDAISVAYRPQGGNAPGQQRYLRLVVDQSFLSGNRTQLPDSLKYPWFHFYKKYNTEDPNDPNKGYYLDFEDLYFRTSVLIPDTDHCIKSDKWSRCKHRSDGQRDGDFLYGDLILELDSDYAQFTKARNKSAYHEQVIVARYMQVDDPWPDKVPNLSTDGKKFTVVYEPKTPKNEDELLMQLVTQANYISSAYDPGYCFMDGQKYNMGIYYK